MSTDTATFAATALRKSREPLWRRRRVQFAAAVVIDLILVYVVWEVLSTTGVLPQRFFPDANSVIHRLGQLLALPAFWAVLGQTLQSWGLGLIIAGVSGTVFGILLGSSDRAYRFFRVIIEVLRPIPPIVILPLALLLLGVTLQMKLLLIVQGTFWVVLLQAVYGVRSVDAITLDTAQVYGISKVRRFLTIQLPGSLPLIVTGIRIAAIFALIVSIVAELVGGAPGLGNEILKAMSTGDNETMYALILLTGVLGVIITAVFSGLERIVLFWHPSHREVSL
ncbi:aliphatic sulfonate ABC transporter permease SsuC [Microbacterium kribbense]|uniref:Aliphatic sulfonate ABC transporter permease SsuC n=1 Tax=Microbacterium kribbense TaxID=433645 RepID=A0ABP7G1R3_9MICO